MGSFGVENSWVQSPKLSFAGGPVTVNFSSFSNNESGFPNFEASVWYGFVGPAGLPGPVVARLHAEIQKALALPEVRDRLINAGGEVLPGPVERLTALLVSERARYEKLIREARIQPD